MDELYGQPGILDTEIERTSIEYHPRIKYEPDKPITVNLPTLENSQPTLPLDETTPPDAPLTNIAHQMQQFGTVYTKLDILISRLEQQLQSIQIPLASTDIHRLTTSFPSLDSTIVLSEMVDFSTYKKTFDDPEDPKNSLIQDLVHSYAEDVEGSLELECYEDLKELQNTLSEGYYLFKESVAKNYLSDAIPAIAEIQEESTHILNQAVRKQQASFTQIETLYQTQEQKYYEALRKDYGSPDFFQMNEEYTKAKRSYDFSIRQDHSIQEMSTLTNSLLIGVDDIAGRIQSGLVLGSEIDPEEVMNLVEKQATTNEQKIKLLKLTQLSLKLQVNQQIEDKRQYRDVLKNVNNLARKQRAHDELLTALGLRKTMYLSMYDTLQHLESPSKAPGVESFLNQVAGGLDLVQQQYDSFLQDVYMMYMSEYEVRREKIIKTLEKENARAGYSLVSDHL